MNRRLKILSEYGICRRLILSRRVNGLKIHVRYTLLFLFLLVYSPALAQTPVFGDETQTVAWNPHLASALRVNAQSKGTQVQAVAWNPDANSGQIAVGGTYSDNTPFLTIRNVSDMSLVLDLTPYPNAHLQAIKSVSWNPDGKYLVTSSADGTMVIWNINDPQYPVGQILAQHTSANEFISSVSWSPDGKWIASVSYHQLIRIWNATDSEYPLVSSETVLSAYNAQWSPDSIWLATNGDTGAIVYNISSNGTFIPANRYVLAGPTVQPRVTALMVAWNVAGNQLAFSDPMNGKIHIYSTSSKTLIQSVSTPDIQTTVSWSPDSIRFAYAGINSTVRVIDVASGQQLASYPTGKYGDVENIAWSADSKLIAFPQVGELPAIVTAPVYTPCVIGGMFAWVCQLQGDPM